MIKVTYVQYAGLSLDMLKKVTPQEEYMIEPEIMMDIPEKLFDKWLQNYEEAVNICNELEKYMKGR